MPTPPPVLIVPGIGGSGPDHWQSRWQRALRGATRFSPSSWQRPDAEDWDRALASAVAACASPPLLVAHSLGCHTSARVAHAHPESVAGAFLVAPPDPDGPDFPAEATGFRPFVPLALGVPALVVASEDDPYASPAFSAAAAAGWSARFLDVGPLGHINDDSGVGEWPEGRALLERFIAALP